MEWMWLGMTLGAPAAAALLMVLLRNRGPRLAGWLAGLAAMLSLAAAFALLPALYRGEVRSLGLEWIPAANIRLDLRVDWLTFPFLVTEAGVTLLAVIYGWGYHRLDERAPFFYALLMLFAVGMAGTTLADDMLLFYIF